jgi:hypothetical protein
METAEMRFVTTVTGCRMTDYERVEDIREEFGIADINAIIKC